MKLHSCHVAATFPLLLAGCISIITCGEIQAEDSRQDIRYRRINLTWVRFNCVRLRHLWRISSGKGNSILGKGREDAVEVFAELADDVAGYLLGVRVALILASARWFCVRHSAKQSEAELRASQMQTIFCFRVTLSLLHRREACNRHV